MSDPQPTEADLLVLLHKFYRGDGGKRTGELMRRGWLKVTVTDAGKDALAGKKLRKKPLAKIDETPLPADPFTAPPFWAKDGRPSKADVRRQRHVDLAQLRAELLDAHPDGPTFAALTDQVNALERELGLSETRGGVGQKPMEVSCLRCERVFTPTAMKHDIHGYCRACRIVVNNGSAGT